jgi:hypothetical protein
MSRRLVPAYHISLGIIALGCRHVRTTQAFVVTPALASTVPLPPDTIPPLHSSSDTGCWQQGAKNARIANGAGGCVHPNLWRHPVIYRCRPLLLTSSMEGGKVGMQRGAASEGSAAGLLRPPARGPTLHVYMFVTIVGWGKNTLLDVMLPELR